LLNLKRWFFDTVITGIFDRYSNDIEIRLDPDKVTFSRKNRTLQTKPVIYVEAKPKNPGFLGIDDDGVPEQPHVSIDVFNFKKIRAENALDPENCLEAFFRCCIRKLFDSNVFIRPTIKVYGITLLSALLPENKEIYLQRVLMNAGGRKCEFL